MSSDFDSYNEWYNDLTKEKNMPGGWADILIGSEKRRSSLKSILKAVFKSSKGKTLRPNPTDIFSFCKYTDLDNVRVVIIGQDPYPNEHACGLCFSSEVGMPQSFRNIHNSLVAQKCIPSSLNTADLRGWAYQGVLLINTAFTTLNGETKEHSELWQPYTDLILARIAKYLDERPGLRSVCWLLWGADAVAKESVIKDNSKCGRNHIMKWGHPSGMAAHNQDPNHPGNFAKCDHFRRVIDITKIEYGIPLYWDAIETDIECFTDGSAKPNKSCPEARAGYAVVFTKGPLKGFSIMAKSDHTTKHKGAPQYTHNIRAEGEALRDALRELRKLPLSCWNKAEFVLDCEFYKDLIKSYIPGWLEKGTSISDQKNPDINQSIWDDYSYMVSRGQEITFVHMNSHQKQPPKSDKKKYHMWFWNNYVDILAKQARIKMNEADCTITRVAGYGVMVDYFGGPEEFHSTPTEDI